MMPQLLCLQHDWEEHLQIPQVHPFLHFANREPDVCEWHRDIWGRSTTLVNIQKDVSDSESVKPDRAAPCLVTCSPLAKGSLFLVGNRAGEGETG